MCHYVSLLLTPASAAPDFRTILESHHKHIGDAVDRSLQGSFSADQLYWFATGKVCDCGTALGSLRKDSIPGRVPVTEIKKLQKKGWSERKIQRFVEERDKIIARKERTRHLDEEAGTNPDGWVDIITDLLTCHPRARVGIVLHWYSRGGPAPEVFLPSKIRDCKLDENLGPLLAEMQEDVCYSVRR